MRSYSEFSTKIRQIFRHLPRNKVLRLREEISNPQAILPKWSNTTDTLPSITSNDTQDEICLVSDSPHYIVRVRLRHI